MAEARITEPAGVEAEKKTFPDFEKEEVKISVPFVFPEREKVFVSQSAEKVQREEKISEQPASSADKPARIAVAVKTRKEEPNIPSGSVPIRMAGDVRKNEKVQELRTQPVKVQTGNFIQGRNNFRPLPTKETKFRNISVEQRNKYAIPYAEVKFKKKADVFSPDLSSEEEMRGSVFPRFAFAFSFAMILLLVAASGYFVWSGGLLKGGQVAGASDERNGGFPSIKSGSEYVLTSAGDKIRQSLSLSKVIVQAAIEKNGAEIK